MPRKRMKKMPPLDLLHDLFDYDPLTGGLFRKGAEPCEANCIGSWTRSGHKKVFVKGYGEFAVHRIVYYMYHRRDPGQMFIDHINTDPADNRIQNLRRCRPTTNARNLRRKGKYVVDDEGVGRWVSGVVK
jgi:hypothetical protein